MRGSRHRAAVVAIVAVTAACGTTVPMDQVTRAQAGSSDLSGVAGTTGGSLEPSTAAQSGGSTGTGGTTSPSSVGGGGASSSSTGGGPLVVQPSAGASTGSASRAPIKIGALTANGAAKYQKSLGFSGATGDQTAMTQSVVGYVNAHGGFGGRRVQLVTYDLDTSAFAANPSAATQAACTYFTQDNKVAALASYVALVPESFYACLAKAHVPVVSPDEGVSRDFFQRYPNTLYMPSAPNYTRLLADSVDALWRVGWLTASSRVGLVGYDTNDVHAIVDKGLVPALRKHGLSLVTGMYTAASTSGASEYTGGALKFKSQRVDRVFFAPGGQPIYFALAAQSQGYHPRYELGSLEYPTALADNLPAEQLAGSMGLGWLPYLDLPSNAWSSVSTPGIARCRKAMASAHQDFTSGTTLGIAAWICDEWFFLQQVFAGTAATDEAGFRRAAEELAGSFRPASTFSTSYATGRTHDGASTYRLVAFKASCSCYAYSSGPEHLP
jgi:ABC-type branched-subunit amino acid transport system substrate-binding protein